MFSLRLLYLLSLCHSSEELDKNLIIKDTEEVKTMDKCVDVVIVGAGLTGLTLANLLKEKGVSFVVLEARDRLGGRIHSVKVEDGPVVEMGATWYFPHFKNLFKLLRQKNVELEGQFMKGHTMYEYDSETPARRIYTSGDDDMFRIKGGTSRIVEALYNSLDKSKVILGQPVKEVNRKPDGTMEVVTNDSEARQAYEAKIVVTTVPQQLLINSVKFSPSLPNDLQTVMNNTHAWMGDSIKGAVAYKRPFWKEKGLSGALYSNEGPFVQMYDQSSPDGFALVGFLDDRLAGLPFKERKKKVLEQLVRVFGKEAEEPLEYADTEWRKEEFTVAKDGLRLSRHKNNGHRIYQQYHMGGGLIIGGTETSMSAGGYMEGAVNSAFSIMKIMM